MIDFKPLDESTRCELGECPVYDDRRDAILFEDIVANTIHRVELKTGAHRKWKFPSNVGSFGLTGTGGLVVALRDVVGLFDTDTGAWTDIAVIERDNKDTRLNDGKVGPDGAFWVGTMDDSGRHPSEIEPMGSLYRVTRDGRVERKVGGLLVSNGLAWTPDGRTMYHSDSRGRWIDRWDFDPATGAISGRTRIVKDIAEAAGRPDGAAADAEGCYWSAGVSGACLNRYARDGKLLATYPVPVAAPTMPCFGGADMKTLWVTSLRMGRDPEKLARYPLTGITIVGQSPVAGAPVARFRDR
jgi:sugar lactone lactonase YvrE